jgi:hypothetical protein
MINQGLSCLIQLGSAVKHLLFADTIHISLMSHHLESVTLKLPGAIQVNHLIFRNFIEPPCRLNKLLLFHVPLSFSSVCKRSMCIG